MNHILEHGINAEKIKEDFSILKNGIVYLDNGATTQKPKAVIQAITKFYEESNANVHRGIHQLSQKATLQYEKAHQVVANFINCDAKEIIFTSGTTQSLNMLAFSLSKTLQEGDEIVLTEMEHHSNIVPWQQIAKEKKCILRYIPITKDYRLNMDVAKELITKKTKIVSVTHMSNALGTINPIKELVSLAQAVGAFLVVDAAQSVPHMPVDVKELNCDFLTFSGHKMCGPTGIGVLYGRKELLEILEPVVYGGGMISEVTKENSTWANLPEKFEAGTPNIAGAIGLMSAINYLQDIGMDNIAKHGKEIITYALEKLSHLPYINIIGPSNTEMRGSVISFTIKDMHPHDVNEIIDQDNIAVRAGHHCAMPLMKKLGISGTTRASFYLYNSKKDVDALFSSLEKFSSIKDAELVPIDRNEISSQELTEEEEIYKENIIDHYKDPRNKTVLSTFTHTYKGLNPLCGDHITLYIDLKNNIVENVSFNGDGCAISQASISLLTEEIKGKSIEETFKINRAAVLSLLGIPISHTRLKCALLSLKTLQGALANEEYIRN